jgi:parvulin-like peptidyl-prolyl isomerase
MSQYKEQLRERVIIQAMRNSKSENQVVVSPYQMEKYYKDHIDEFKMGDQVKLRMIYIKKGEPAAAGQPDPRRVLADEIHGKLEAGEKFDALAREYSQGRGASEGGEWGWISKGELLSTLDEAAFSLKAGQHSQVIDAAEGYYILQVEEIKSAHTRSLAEVRDEIEKIIQRDTRTKMLETWLRNLRGDAFVRYRQY